VRLVGASVERGSPTDALFTPTGVLSSPTDVLFTSTDALSTQTYVLSISTDALSTSTDQVSLRLVGARVWSEAVPLQRGALLKVRVQLPVRGLGGDGTKGSQSGLYPEPLTLNPTP